MNWLTNFVRPKIRALTGKGIKKESLWQKCDSCEKMIFHRELLEKYYVCTNCGFHLNFPLKNRLEHLFDDKKYTEIQLPEIKEDPIKFKVKAK